MSLSFAVALGALACVSGDGALPGGTGGGASPAGGATGAGTAGSNGAGGTTAVGGSNGTAGTTGGVGGAVAAGGRTGAGGIVGGAGGATPPPPPFKPPFTCTIPTWPTPVGATVNIGSTMNITGTYDGKMALHNGSGSGDFGKDCTASGTGAQGTTSPLFQLANNATIQNVIIGTHGADGIHCAGTCTIKNVWFQAVCDDGVTAAEGSSGTVTIDGGGARGAHDKMFQDNSHGKFIIQNYYGEKMGKMYRACGAGGACGTTKGTVTVTNTIAIGVDEIVGVTAGRDTATFSHVCVYQTPTICQPYSASDSKLATDGNDGTTCKYPFAEVQVMLDHAAPTLWGTGTACPNYFKSSSSTATGTACLPDLPNCIKYCAPGSNGLKQCNCLNGQYSCKGCSGPALEPAKSGLAPTKFATAPACNVTTDSACPTEWNWCIDTGQDCVCVYKPGTLQTANTVWDCVNPWY